MCNGRGHIWRYSVADLWLILFSIFEVALKIILIVNFHNLSYPALVIFSVTLVILNCMNYECAGHYFIHTPFFVDDRFNGLFSIFNSIAFGFPQTLYRTEHLNHHRYVNDFRNPKTGKTNDASSIYRHGPNDCQPEPIWKYAAFTPVRQDAVELVRNTPKRLRRILFLETGAVMTMLAIAAIIDFKLLLLLLFISWMGSVATHIQNWLEHAHADPLSRMTNAVSAYGRIYNWVWFNNGYHQEHHYSASTHWTKLPTLRFKLPPPSRRRVVPHAHFWNLKR